MPTTPDPDWADLEQSVRTVATEEALSGVVRVDVNGQNLVEAAFGHSHRGLGIAMTTDAQLAIASGSKAFTALVVMSLVERGDLSLDTLVRSILGDDLALVDDRVTVEHLLAHRSGIGDYLDEDTVNDPNAYVMPVPVHELDTTDDYLAILDGHPSKFTPGERFEYCNSGYVILALLTERVSGRSFHDLVDNDVCTPAGMTDTAFLRSDSLPGRAALGYLDDDGLSTNVLHLPVRGKADGGICTNSGRCPRLLGCPDGRADRLTRHRARDDPPPQRRRDIGGLRHGLGFWLGAHDETVSIHGFDTGVGFVSVHDPSRRTTFTVMSNKSRGAWPCSQRISQILTSR